ncbi:hypothetical protein Tco_0205782 [Tanacetum coccineum]
MTCSLSHTIDEIQALVQKLMDEDIVRQKAIMELAVQFDNASTAKDDLRKVYEKCNDILQESRAFIDTFLKHESDKEYEMNLAMLRWAIVQALDLPRLPHLINTRTRLETNKGSGGNQGGQSSSDTSISGNEGGLTLQSVYDLYLSLYQLRWAIVQALDLPRLPHLINTRTRLETNSSIQLAMSSHIGEGSGGNQGGQSSSDTSISGNEGGLTLQSVYDLYLSLCTQVTTQAAEIKALKAVKIKKQQKQRRSVSIQGRITVKSTSKAEPSMHKDQAIDDFDRMDYMETDAYKEEGVSTEDKVSIDKHKVSTDKHEVSTDQQSEVTDRANVSTDGQDKGTAEKKEKDLRETATQTSPTTTSAPTSAIFGDDETITQVLITISQNKEKLKEKEKGVELRDVEEIKRPRPTSTRSVLTLEPLPKIDPKDKGKKRIEEDKSDESDT